MTLTCKVKDNKAIISKDGIEVDEVGPWETASEAEAWGAAVVAKYNSAEYASVDYPNEKEESN
jgi:hypothetical protein